MSASRHPIALRLERQVGEGTRLLATVMALPLLDGIFAAVVLAGAVSSVLGMLEVGLLIFGGSATLAVVLVEMDGSRRDRVRNILLVGLVVVPVAALQAAVAPTIASVLEMAIFERFAALVILAIAAKTASATIGEYLPRPGVIIGLGFVASVRPTGFDPAIVAEPMYVAYGTGAAVIGVAFALSVALLAPWLRGNVDVDRFRFGSAIALGVLPFTILEVIPTDAPLALAVLGVASLLAFDPSGTNTALDADGPEPAAGTATDGGADADAKGSSRRDGQQADGRDRGHRSLDESDRAPWL